MILDQYVSCLYYDMTCLFVAVAFLLILSIIEISILLYSLSCRYINTVLAGSEMMKNSLKNRHRQDLSLFHSSCYNLQRIPRFVLENVFFHGGTTFY